MANESIGDLVRELFGADGGGDLDVPVREVHEPVVLA